MTEETLFPKYIPRQEERQILAEAAQVQEHRTSRAVLLYGLGGVGKTQLVRALARAHAADKSTIWLDPIDIDDSTYWLLSNLEENVATQLDPENRYFGPYREYLSRLPTYTRPSISHETIISHLGRIKQVFVECYKTFIGNGRKTVVIVFDTVETVRGTYLILTLTQWMKALPATLFIVSGRPPPRHGREQDPIKRELDEDIYRPIPVTTIRLGEFTQQAAGEYLTNSRVAAGLADEEKAKLVRLTRGHPLWLALTISYLDERGIPEELEVSLAEIKRNVPYRRRMSRAGQNLHEAFKGRLIAPYREADFWHEAIKRLAVVRQGVNKVIWQKLMADRPLPEKSRNLDEAWEHLLEIPWIRPRSNGRFVTLHDAMAEELAQRIIPLHDQDQRWRSELWQLAVDIYREQTEGPKAELAGKLETLDEELQSLNEGLRVGDERGAPSEDQSSFIKKAARLDARKRELDQFTAARLHYQLLCDFAEGCRQFLDLFGQAKREHDILFQDLLALGMQRFLPGEDDPAFDDVAAGVIGELRHWLSSARPQLYLEIGLSMADYLIDTEQTEAAVKLLEGLPIADANPRQRFRSDILLGNAYLRVPGRVKEGLPHFHSALALAKEAVLTSADGQKMIAVAYKELGFFYRNEGLWKEADGAYRQAFDAIAATLSVRSSPEDREEMASIQTNWAYVKGLGGHYREGSNLIESAITVRQRLKKHLEEGISWSVCGEIYRYEERFHKAWDAYSEAERIFEEQRSWPWLGMIYQEQAICLFQAVQDGVGLQTGMDPIEQSKQLITQALNICRDQNIRGYPSALNRAGRIFGQKDFDAGLRYLAEGIEQARTLSDGWFWFANLVESAELSYRAWVETRLDKYRDKIAQQKAGIEEAMSQYEFPDLRGRWDIVQGHLAIHKWEETRDDSLLRAAMPHYKQGFVLIAEGGHVGSSGTSVIPGGFATFGGLFRRLPSDVRAEWQEEFRRAWSGLDQGSTMLLSRLEQMY